MAVRVPDRQHSVEHVLLAKFLAFGGRSHGHHGRVVGMQDALGFAAAAGGEDHVGHGVGGGRAGQVPGRRLPAADDSAVAGDPHTGCGRGPETTVPDHDHGATPALPREHGHDCLGRPVPAEGRDRHHRPRLGKADDPAELAGAERRHDVRHDGPDPFRGQDGRHELADGRQRDQHDVARFHTLHQQAPGQCQGLGGEFVIAVGAAAVHNGDLGGVPPGMAKHMIEQDLVPPEPAPVAFGRPKSAGVSPSCSRRCVNSPSGPGS